MMGLWPTRGSVFDGSQNSLIYFVTVHQGLNKLLPGWGEDEPQRLEQRLFFFFR